MPKLIGTDESVAKRVTHRACGAILEYFENETRKAKVNHDYLGDYDIVKVITCPKCGEDVQVK